jgi:hypothetical protein
MNVIYRIIVQCGMDALDDATAEVRLRGAQLLFIAQRIDQVNGITAYIDALCEKKAHCVREAISRITLEECSDTIFAPVGQESTTKLSKAEAPATTKSFTRLHISFNFHPETVLYAL